MTCWRCGKRLDIIDCLELGVDTDICTHCTREVKESE